MPQPDETPTTGFFENFIAAYGKAWDNYDLETILGFYHTPCFIFKAGKVFANLTAETKALYFQDLLNVYREYDYAWADVMHFEVKNLGRNSALVTVYWVCRRSDGSVIFEYWDSYHLIHLEHGWKILDDTVHDA